MDEPESESKPFPIDALTPIRESLGFQPIASETPELPVDRRLLKDFVRNHEMSECDLDVVLNNLGKYQNWRDECKRLVVNQFKQNQEITPENREPESP